MYLKHAVERILCRIRVTNAMRRLYTRRTTILAYHNVIPDGERATGDTSLHLSQAQFAKQLDQITRTHDVISLEQLLGPIMSHSHRPRAIITFDDAYQGALTAGVDELARRRLPATIFVAPQFVNGHSFWWDALSRPDGTGLDDMLREHALDQYAGLDQAIRAWATRDGLQIRDVPSHQTAATMRQLEHADSLPGISLGAHTWSHINLQKADDSSFEKEIAKPLQWLRQNFKTAIPWLSYPYGLTTPAVERFAHKEGYAGALLIEGGRLHDRMVRETPYKLPRINIPANISSEGFELRSSGVL